MGNFLSYTETSGVTQIVLDIGHSVCVDSGPGLVCTHPSIFQGFYSFQFPPVHWEGFPMHLCFGPWKGCFLLGHPGFQQECHFWEFFPRRNQDPPICHWSDLSFSHFHLFVKNPYIYVLEPALPEIGQKGNTHADKQSFQLDKRDSCIIMRLGLQ